MIGLIASPYWKITDTYAASDFSEGSTTVGTDYAVPVPGTYHDFDVSVTSGATTVRGIVTAKLVKNTSGVGIAQYDLAEYASGSRLNVFESTTDKTGKGKIAGIAAAALADGSFGWVVVKGVFKALAGTGDVAANVPIMASADNGAVYQIAPTTVAELGAVIGMGLEAITAASTGLVWIDLE